MKKIVIATLPLKKNHERRHYPVDGNALIEVEQPIYYAVNPAVAHNLKKEDEVKVILLETKGGENAGTENAKNFIDELNEFNKVGASISKALIPSPYDESKTNFQNMYKTLIGELDQGAEIYCDLTFGPKPLAFLVFSVLRFAEKFYDCKVGNIVYSKVEFQENKIIEGSEKIYDITPLYLLDIFTNTIQSLSKENAVKAVDALLGGGLVHETEDFRFCL